MTDSCKDGGDGQDTSLFGLPTAAVAGIASGCAGLLIIVVFFCCKARSKRKREEREYEYYTATSDPQAMVSAAAAPDSTSKHKRKDSFGSFTNPHQPPPPPMQAWSSHLPDSTSAPLPSSQSHQPSYQPQPPLPPQLPGRPGYHARSYSNDYPSTYNIGASSRQSTSSSEGSYAPLHAAHAATKSKPKKGIMKSATTTATPHTPGPYSSALVANPGLAGSSSSLFFSALKTGGKKLLAPPSSPAKSKPHQHDAALPSPAGTAPPPYSEGIRSPGLSDAKPKHRFWPFGASTSHAQSGLVTPAMPSTATGTNVSGSNWYSSAAAAATPGTHVGNEAAGFRGKGKQVAETTGATTTYGAPTITVTHASRGNSLASNHFMATSGAYSTASGGQAATSFGGGSSWQGGSTSYGGDGGGAPTTIGGGSSWHPGAASSYQGSSNYAPTVQSASTSNRAYQLAGPSSVGGGSQKPGRGAGAGYAESAGGSSYKTSDKAAKSNKGIGAPSSFGGSSWQGGQKTAGAASTFYTGGSSWQGGGATTAAASSAGPLFNSASFGPKLRSGPGSSGGGSEAGSSSSKKSGKRYVLAARFSLPGTC